jgi:hypothetical protein
MPAPPSASRLPHHLTPSESASAYMQKSLQSQPTHANHHGQCTVNMQKSLQSQPTHANHHGQCTVNMQKSLQSQPTHANHHGHHALMTSRSNRGVEGERVLRGPACGRSEPRIVEQSLLLLAFRSHAKFSPIWCQTHRPRGPHSMGWCRPRCGVASPMPRCGAASPMIRLAVLWPSRHPCAPRPPGCACRRCLGGVGSALHL